MRTSFHLERIKAEADLVAIIGKDTGVPLKRKGNGPRGVEYSGPCPLCGQAHSDGLVVQPENKPFPTWFCRKCTGPAALTAIDYIARREKFDPHKREDLDRIVYLLGGDAAPTHTGEIVPREKVFQPAKVAPAQAWQTAALAYIEYAERQLWLPKGEQALFYLHSRGLRDETIKRYRLGFNPKGMYRPAAKWGTPNDNPKDLYLRPGIVIPWIAQGDVWAINTRNMGAVDPQDRYRKVRGSRGAIYNADLIERASVVLYVEGELDCILAQQEAGGRLAVVSLGSGSGIPDRAAWGYHFLKPNLTLYLPDNDDAGWEAAERFAQADLARSLVWVGLPDNSKDLGDFYRAGGNVLAWIQDHLQAHDPVYAYVSTLAGALGATVSEI